MSANEGIAQKIISQGYFAKQIPGEFNSELLGEKINLLDLSKSKLSGYIYNKWCKLIDYSIPKTDNFRRNLSIPHPLHYILLAQLLEEKWVDLNDHFSKSLYSLTTPKVSEEGIKSKYNMSERINKRTNYLAYNKYILQADIVRYYPSIYTHSISWALYTKEEAKTKSFMQNNDLIGNSIDRLIRNMQEGQTIGIPIGPVTSSIIQEIIGVVIDEEFEGEYGGDLVGFRYTDDMEYYFSSREEAERALTILSKILKKYELDLNNSKTKIIKIPQVLEPEWVYFFKKFKFRRNCEYEKSVKIQETDIKEFFSKAFNFKIQNEDNGILNYAIKVVRNEKIYKENWDLFEALLFQTTQVDPSIIPTVFEVIESYKYRGYPLNYTRIKRSINLLIKNNIELNNEFETVWALSFSLRLNINISEEISVLLLKNDNAIINIFAMLLNDKELLIGELDWSYYKSILSTEDILYDSGWLFYYESCIQGWLGKDKSSENLTQNQFFSQLVKEEITFINRDYSKVFEKMKDSIVTLCLDRYKEDMRSSTVEAILQNVLEEYSYSLEDNITEEIKTQLMIGIKMIKEEAAKEGEIEVQPGGNRGKDQSEGKNEHKETEEWIDSFFSTNITKASRIKSMIFDDYNG